MCTFLEHIFHDLPVGIPGTLPALIRVHLHACKTEYYTHPAAVKSLLARNKRMLVANVKLKLGAIA